MIMGKMVLVEKKSSFRARQEMTKNNTYEMSATINLHLFLFFFQSQ